MAAQNAKRQAQRRFEGLGAVADISWDDEGRARHQLLTGISDYFKVIDDAELNAVEVAMAWIDAELAKNGRAQGFDGRRQSAACNYHFSG